MPPVPKPPKTEKKPRKPMAHGKPLSRGKPMAKSTKPIKAKRKKDTRITLTGGTCWVTGVRSAGNHIHEIFYGKNRQLSIRYGMMVDIQLEYHNMSDKGVHFNDELDSKLKKWGQTRFKELHPGLDFVQIFGRSYL